MDKLTRIWTTCYIPIASNRSTRQSKLQAFNQYLWQAMKVQIMTLLPSTKLVPRSSKRFLSMFHFIDLKDFRSIKKYNNVTNEAKMWWNKDEKNSWWESTYKIHYILLIHYVNPHYFFNISHQLHNYSY